MKIFQTTADGLCLARSILQQVIHHPHAYTPELLMKQAALHMIRHPYRFYKYLEQELTETGESYESYCVNVYNCNVWGDDLIASVIGDMWNLSITILSPVFKKPFHLFHNKTAEPEVVIVSNGGSYLCTEKGSTHFTATMPLSTNYQKPGSEHLHSNIGPDMNPKLMPLILEDKKKARDIALKEYLKVDTELSLGLLRSVTRQLNRIDDHITSLIKESDDLNRQKDVLTNQLLQLGLSAERIKEITDMKKERQYCRTTEREEIDKANERKRKAEEEKWDKAKKQKVVALVEGEEEPDYGMPTPEKAKETEEHDSKVRRQQKQIIEQQEQLLQRQEAELVRKQRIIDQQEQAMTREPIIVQPSQTSSSVQPGTSTITTGGPQISSSVQPGTSMRTGGVATIDRFLSARNMEYLRNLPASEVPCREVQDVHGIGPQEIQTTEIQSGDVVIAEPQLQQPQQEPQQQPQKVSQTIYVPKIAESSHIVLIPTPSKKSTPLRSGTSGPVPLELQDPKRFYCKNCHGNYATKDELTRHEQKVCGKEIAEYICDACDKTYYWPNPLREHYYKQHVKVIMYHCPRCNKPFSYSSKLSVHLRTNCPNKDGPEIYKKMIDLDPAVEEKFKPKVPLEIENPDAIQPQEVVEGDEQEVGAQIVGGGDEQEVGAQVVAGDDQQEGGVQVVGGSVQVLGEGNEQEGDIQVVGTGNVQEYQLTEEQHQVAGETLGEELLREIQKHEQEEKEKQEEVIIIKTDDVADDADAERLLDVMSQGNIPEVKDDEENGGQVKPEEDALLD